MKEIEVIKVLTTVRGQKEEIDLVGESWHVEDQSCRRDEDIIESPSKNGQ